LGNATGDALTRVQQNLAVWMPVCVFGAVATQTLKQASNNK
jgi:hypothetical protein